MKTIYTLLLFIGFTFLFVPQEVKAGGTLAKPCIKVDGNIPTPGSPKTYKVCTNRTVILSVYDCSAIVNPIPLSSLTYSWFNTSNSSFLYSTQTVTTSQIGTWILTVSYTDSLGVVYTAGDTLNLLNFAATPITITGGGSTTTYAHCPYTPLTFKATVNTAILAHTYKWYVNSSSSPDTAVTLADTGSVYTTTLLTSSYVLVTARDTNGCITEANINAPLLPTPLAPNIGTTHSVCPGQSITLTATAEAGDSYAWDGGTASATNTYTTSTLGKHWVTVQKGLGCTLSDTTYISNYTPPIVNIGHDSSICYLEKGTVLATVSGTPSYTYAWTPAVYFTTANSASSTVTFTTIGTVTVSLLVTDGNTCTTTVSKTLTYLAQGSNPYLNVAVSNLNICQNTTKTFNTTVNATYPTTLTYNWSPSTYLSDSIIANPTVNMSSATLNTPFTYSLKVTDYKGCYTTVNTTTTLVPAVTANLAFTDTTVCPNTPITLHSSASGGTGSITYSWTPTLGLSSASSANPIVTINQNQLYALNVTDIFGCTNTKTVTVNTDHVTVSFTATDTSGYSEPPIVLKPNANANNYTYAWSVGATETILGTKSTLTVTTSGMYKVTVTSPGSDCSAIDSINVTIKSGNPKVIYIPNAFNPSSTNTENNVVKVYGIAVLEDDFYFRIYNQWGDVIYQTTSFTEANTMGWNGTYNGDGKDQSLAVFTYALHGKYFDGSPFDKAGSITLIR